MISLKGKVLLSGDKSVTHRAIILAALADGPTSLENISGCVDVTNTLTAFLGLDAIGYKKTGRTLKITPGPWTRGDYSIDCGNSGTTMRLLTGVLAAMPGVNVRLTGDASLMKRPMDRVAEPLSAMGAGIATNNGLPPVEIEGGLLHGAEIASGCPSAQVKSAVLLAGLRARGVTRYIESVPTRDHTERLFRYLGIPIETSGGSGGKIMEIRGPAHHEGFAMRIPGDVSNAAILTALALSLPGSDIFLPEVLYNPLRNGFFDNLAKMGANIAISSVRQVPESTCDISVSHTGPLMDFDISAGSVVTMIDEVPVFVITAVLHGAKGVVRGISELRVKESDRVKGLLGLLGMLGAKAVVRADDLIVQTPAITRPEKLVYTGKDHRIGFAYMLAGMALDIDVELEKSIPGVSYTEFYDDLGRLSQ